MSKEKAIVFFRLYGRLSSIIPSLVGNTEFKIISDRDFNFSPALAPNRFLTTDKLLDLKLIESSAQQEAASRLDVIYSMVVENAKALPYSTESFNPASLSKLKFQIERSLNRYFFHAEVLNQLSEIYDVKAVLCCPSFLEQNQAVITTARSKGIPSVHLQHGIWISTEALHPEKADVVMLASEFARQILDEHSLSNAKRTVTGLPFSNPAISNIDDLESDRELKLKAREKLGIPADSEVALFSCVLGEGFEAVADVYAYKRVTTLAAVISALKARENDGRETALIVRQHPSIKDSEHQEAIIGMAKELGYENIKIINEDRDATILASDFVITGSKDSSVSFDAFLLGRPAFAVDGVPRPEHYWAFRKMLDYRRVTKSDAETAEEINRLFDDQEYWLKRRKEGWQFAKSLQPDQVEESLKTISDEIEQLANVGLQS